MTTHTFTISITTDRDVNEVRDTIHDLLHDKIEGFIGDPDDMAGCELVAVH